MLKVGLVSVYILFAAAIVGECFAAPAEWMRESPQNRLVLVMVGTTLCPSCMAYEPAFRRVAESYGTTVEVRYTIAQNAEFSFMNRFGVYGYPTVLAMRHGEIIGTLAAPVSEAETRRFVEEMLCKE